MFNYNWNTLRLADLVKKKFAQNGFLLSRYDTLHRAEWLNEIDRIAAERTLLLNPGEACQLLSALEATVRIDGDIAELGVAYGASAKLIASHAGKRVVHLFDTFDGLPPPGEGDSAKFRTGDFYSQLADVQTYLAPYNCRFYKGLFPDTTAPVANTRFSFVHLDVDLYESTLAGLNFFYPRMSPGGILISHDYLSADGVNRAVKEFFSDKPDPFIELVSGYQCMMVKL